MEGEAEAIQENEFHLMKTREKVSFLRPVRTPDGLGGGNYVNQVYWTPPAVFVEQLNMAETNLASQKGLQMLIEIECRYNPEKPVKAGDLVEWRGFLLTSMRPIPDRSGRKMTIRAYSEIETSNRES